MSGARQAGRTLQAAGQVEVCQSKETTPRTPTEAAEEITTLAGHLPEEFQVSSLLAVARDASQKGSLLAQLYLDRCFRLSDGDVDSARELEQQIPVPQGLSLAL